MSPHEDTYQTRFFTLSTKRITSPEVYAAPAKFLLDLLSPISVVVKKIIIVPGIHHRFYKHSHDL